VDGAPVSDHDADAGGSTPRMPDLGGLLDSFQKVQAARDQVYEGMAGGGAVKVQALGDGSFQSVQIAAEVVDPTDVDLLQDLVLAALHDLTTQMARAQHDAMGALGGMDLGGLLGGLVLPDDTE
jgi:DNA-binding protein YbaB